MTTTNGISNEFAAYLAAAHLFGVHPTATNYLLLERAALVWQLARFPDAAPAMTATQLAANQLAQAEKALKQAPTPSLSTSIAQLRREIQSCLR